MKRKGSALSKIILIIDDDKEFTSYLKRVGDNYDYQVEVANSIAAARSRIQKDHIDAFIIDAELGDGNGLDFYKELLESNLEHTKFAFVSAGYRSPKDYSYLKGELGFDVVLAKPLHLGSVQSLFKVLVEDPTLTEDELLLEEIGKSFQEAAPAKIERLNDLVVDFYRSGEEESLIDFRKIIHRLAGTASSFGLGQVTEMCRSLDMTLMDLEDKHELFKITKDQLDEFINDLMVAFQFPNWTRGQSLVQEDDGIDLVLVSEDPVLISRFQKISINHHFKMNIVKSLEETLRIHNDDVNKEAHYFLDTELVCQCDEWEKLFSEVLTKDNRIFIIKESIEVKEVIGKIELGDINVLPYESNLRYLTWFIYQHFHHPNVVHSKILVWGSENQKENLHQLLSSYINDQIEWSGVNKGCEVINALNPIVATVVVLLDSGDQDYEKIRQLRADERSANIKVVIVAKENNPVREILALQSGANAYYEANNSSAIGEWLSSHLALEVGQASKINKQGANGVLSFGGFLQRGLETVSRSMRNNDQFSLVRLGFRGAAKFKKEHGQAELMKLMNEVGMHVSVRLRLSDLVGVSQEGEFIALLEGASKRDSFPLITRIIEEIAKIIKLKEEKLELTAGLVSFPEDGSSFNILLKRSQEIFKRAMIGQEGSVLKWSESHRLAIHNERGILIVEPEEKLGSMLEFSLKAKGWPVKRVHNSEQVMKVLESGYRPILILSERVLPEGDGVALLKKVNAFSETRFLWFFLTSKGANEDIISGLKAGAKDYIVKPFSLDVLMAKIKNFLQH